MQQVNLTWSASTDNVSVAGYYIYYGKSASSMTLIGNSTTTSFTDTVGLTPGTTYYFAVAAYDEVLNVSAQSAAVTATTVADTQPPTVPQNLTATAAGMQQVNLTWSASTDNVVVAGYKIYSGKSASSMSLVGNTTTTSFTDTTGLMPGTTYYFAVLAYDEAANNSAQSATAAATTAADTQPPTVPQNLAATAAGMQQVNLSWSASTDNVVVSGYAIYRGTSSSSLTLVGETTSTSFVDTSSLRPGTLYYYAVAAFDESSNYSTQSPQVTVTTTADTQPPTVPQNLSASGTSGTQINLTWSASTDNIAVYDYRVYRGTTSTSLTLIGSSQTASYTDSSTLKAHQVYYYAVSAVDTSSNASAESSVVSITNP
jgi:fibronectin type 3 domain-containing protein